MNEPIEQASAIHAMRGLLTDLQEGRGTRVRSNSRALGEIVREMQAVGAPPDLIYEVMRKYPDVASELTPRRGRLSRLLRRRQQRDGEHGVSPFALPVVHDQQMQLPAVTGEDRDDS